ncbi:zinc-dependent alcohol dehydrogenase [Metabacillus litoralis]|jgi:2-desacetyl-2-hydroxyethyl bacteriochlorophyllide A dehydrogenase|uniref:zinc-dependent alcohol dehydrogenase n=1 Tax=Metabacillus litoralis TaxID=152268 RepID=UPI00203FF095|nr:zinc-dependent alcohol dehydrogenase family protein [Metabacillus litoralis]MCM3652293.1 zinc-dependent alcohol dehydrogenase family protein [Metabacillus litoralis]
MLAGVFEKVGSLAIQEKEVPTLKSELDVKIKVLAASICGTDVHILSDPPGHPATTGVIQGHEYMGEVVEIGKEVKNVNVGDRVIVDPTTTCGSCHYCQIGKPNMCENSSTLGIFLDGGWASYSVVPSKNLFKISKEIAPEIAVLAEPLSCVIHGSERVNVQPGDSVVIVGAGPMGQLFTQVLKAAGATKVICADFSDYRLDYAKKSGATHVINPKNKDLIKAVREITEVGADVVVDCVGALFDQCMSLVRHGGQILLVGMNEHANPQIKQYDLTKNEITVKGTYIQNYDFPKVVKVLESNLLNLESLITHKISLDKISEGIDTMRKGEAIKIIVYPE